MDLHLTDKVAIVTGSSKGLGLASARALAAEGARVVLCARGAEALAKAAADLSSSAPGRIASAQADVSTAAGADSVVDAAIRQFGRIDILINNVGKATGTDIVSTTDEEWQSALDQTLFPAVRMSRLVVPH